MARPLRIEFEGAWYHVMNRGAARQDVFVSDMQRERFTQLLADLVDRFGIETHAYCLMGNHYRAPRGALLPCGLKYPNRLAAASPGSRGQVNRWHDRGSGSSPDNVATHRHCQTVCAR